MEEEFDEFGVPIKPLANESKPAKPTTAKVEVDEYGVPIKKKEGTTPGSEQPVQPSATSGGPDQASVDKQKTLLSNVKRLYKNFLNDADQALNDGWDVDYTKKHFSDRRGQISSMLDEMDSLGGDDVRKWTSGMRSAMENSQNNVVAQRDSYLSYFSDPENLYAEDKGNREWFSKNVKEVEGILSGRQAANPKEGLPSVKVPKKKEFGKGEVPSLREIVQKPQAEMFKPEEDDYTSERLKIAAYQEANDKYKDLVGLTKNVTVTTNKAGNTEIGNVVVDYNLLIQNEEMWKKYVGEDLPWPGGVYEPNPQKRKDIRLEAENRIKQKIQNASDNVGETLDTKIIDKIVEENFNEKTFAHFLKAPDEDITQTTVDSSKLDEQVRKIIEQYGLDPNGSAVSILYDKANAAVQSQSTQYDTDEYFKEEHPEAYALREKYKSGKFQEEINARYISDIEAMYSQYESQANTEIDAIVSVAKKQADQLAIKYNEQTDAIKQEVKKLGEDYQNGVIDELTYNDAFNKYNQQLAELGDAFQALLPDQSQLMEEANKIYSRYNSTFEMRKAEMVKRADEELKKYAAGIPEEDLKTINTAYQMSFDKAMSERNSELFKQMKMTQQESVIPLYIARRSFMNGLGSFIKNIGNYTDSQDLKVMGETMQNEWSSAAPKVKDIGFNADDLYYNSQIALGNMGGNMAPALLGTGLVSYFSGGAATGQAVTLMAGWVGNWASETMSIAGENGAAVLAKTGDVRRSEQAVSRSIDAQKDLFFTYAIDGLPFTKGAYRLVSGWGKGLGADISGRAARAVVGGAVEVLQETFLQELPQNIAQENIVEKERDPWTNFGEMYSRERIKETLVGVAPIGILGFIGGARTGSLAQQRVDEAQAFNDKATLAGGFEDQRRQYLQGLVFEKNEKYARGVVSSLYATGNIDVNEAAQMQEQITDANRIKLAADNAKLNTSQRNVYGFFSARADEARRNADKNSNDPILEKMYRQQQAQYERVGAEYLQGKSPDMLTLTYADGTSMMMTPEDAKGLSENKDFLTLLAKKRVSVSGYGNTQPILDQLQTSVNNHETSTTWKQKAEKLTGMVKSIVEPRRVDIEDKKPMPTEAAQKQVDQNYNNTADLLKAMKAGDQFLTTVIGNPLWGKLADDKRNAITSLSGQMAKDRQLMADNDSESNEYKQAKERIAANEKAVYDILNGKVDDTKNITGVPGQVGVGQKPVETQPVEGAGTETTTTGGVLQEEEVADPRQRVLNSITEQDFIDNAPAITTPDIERIKSDDASKQQAAEKARKEAESAYAYLDGQKTAKEFLADNGYDVEGMSDEDAKKYADSDAEYWKNKLTAEEAKGGKKPTKAKKPGRTKGAKIAQKEQEKMDLLESGVQSSQERIKQLIAEGATPDQAYAITEAEWKQTEDGKKYVALQEEIAKMSQEKEPAPSRKKKEPEPLKMPEIPTGGQQRIATINSLEEAVFKSATGESDMSLEEVNQAQATVAEMKKQNKEGGLNEAELAMKKALGEKVVTRSDVDKMVKEKKVKEKCPPKSKKAEHGMSFGFKPGGKWQVVKNFKGKSHENGGIDIEVIGGKLKYTDKDASTKAKNGMYWTMKGVDSDKK